MNDPAESREVVRKLRRWAATCEGQMEGQDADGFLFWESGFIALSEAADWLDDWMANKPEKTVNPAAQ